MPTYIARRAFDYNGLHVAQGAIWYPAGLRAGLVVAQKERPIAMEQPAIKESARARKDGA
jgi:hypothetical protein